ncbi:hypothetical protein ABD76_01665 [Paenibacillus dendritiformis]|uniref:hypothetical protein n=1 Tax=Paenibacillus dendritiformis TaxID=130049 RepID=UPI0018CD45E2|nr:hypothetical protein [Paenibacillus dendritiformis]MBG9791313.1 hypothetical protein [Paenibacillus dendritiformis]
MIIKKLVVATLFLGSICSVSSSAFAEPLETGSKVVFEQAEIVDTSELLKRAKNGNSDKKNSVVKTHAFARNTATGEVKNARIFSTTQKLKVLQRNGSFTETYATTTFAEFLADGSRSDSGYDDSYSVRAYSTFYWDNVNINNAHHYKILNATGGWQNSDSQISVLNRSASLLAYGFTMDGFYVIQSKDASPSSNSFSINADSTWKPIYAKQSNYGDLGVYTKCTVKDLTNNETWELELKNYLPV